MTAQMYECVRKLLLKMNLLFEEIKEFKTKFLGPCESNNQEMLQEHTAGVPLSHSAHPYKSDLTVASFFHS